MPIFFLFHMFGAHFFALSIRSTFVPSRLLFWNRLFAVAVAVAAALFFGKLQACTGICAPPNQIPATHLEKKNKYAQFVHTQRNYLYAAADAAAAAAVAAFSLSHCILLNVFSICNNRILFARKITLKVCVIESKTVFQVFDFISTRFIVIRWFWCLRLQLVFRFFFFFVFFSICFRRVCVACSLLDCSDSGHGCTSNGSNIQLNWHRWWSCKTFPNVHYHFVDVVVVAVRLSCASQFQNCNCVIRTGGEWRNETITTTSSQRSKNRVRLIDSSAC